VLERIFEVREQARLVEELAGLQARKTGTHTIHSSLGERLQDGERGLHADDGSGLQQSLVIRG
jgi:hypothetical protein